MVDQFRVSALVPNVFHLHGDGDRWVRMQPEPDFDVAEDDPERQWLNGRLFACPECDEKVVVDLDKDDRTPT